MELELFQNELHQLQSCLDVKVAKGSEVRLVFNHAQQHVKSLLEKQKHLQSLLGDRHKLQQEKELLEKEVNELEILLKGQPPSLWMQREMSYKRDRREYEIRMRKMESELSRLRKRVKELQSQEYIKTVEERADFLKAQNDILSKDNTKLSRNFEEFAVNLGSIRRSQNPSWSKIREQIQKLEKVKGLGLRIHNISSGLSGIHGYTSSDSQSSQLEHLPSESGESSRVGQSMDDYTQIMDVNSELRSTENSTRQHDPLGTIQFQISSDEIGAKQILNTPHQYVRDVIGNPNLKKQQLTQNPLNGQEQVKVSASPSLKYDHSVSHSFCKEQQNNSLQQGYKPRPIKAENYNVNQDEDISQVNQLNISRQQADATLENIYRINVVKGGYQRASGGDSLQTNFDFNSSNFLQKHKLTQNVEQQLHQQVVHSKIVQDQDQQFKFSNQQVADTSQSYNGSNLNSQVGQFSQNEVFVEEGAGQPFITRHFVHCEDEISSESDIQRKGLEQQMYNNKMGSNNQQDGWIGGNNQVNYDQDGVRDEDKVGELQKLSTREAKVTDAVQTDFDNCGNKSDEQVDMELLQVLKERNREYEQKFKLQEERLARLQHSAVDLDVQRMAAESALEVALNQIHHLQDKRMFSPRSRQKQVVEERFRISQQQHTRLHQRIGSMSVLPDRVIPENKSSDSLSDQDVVENNFQEESETEKQMLVAELAATKMLLAQALEEVDAYVQKSQVVKKGGEKGIIRRAIRRR